MIYDINSEVNTIPDIIKNALYKIHSEKVKTVVLMKQIEKDLILKDSLILTVDNIIFAGEEKEHESIKEKLKEQEMNVVDLKGMLNPESIAENAVDLNVNLMKWRMCPFLDTEIIRKQKKRLHSEASLVFFLAKVPLAWLWYSPSPAVPRVIPRVQ